MFFLLGSMRRTSVTKMLRGGFAVLVMLAALVFAVSCSVQVQEAPPDPAEDPAAYTQYFVNQAIAYYTANGLQATIDFYNSMESIDGQWYMFIGDENDVMLSHAAVPDNVGMRFVDILGPGGYPAGAQAAAAAVEGGSWTTYTYINPAADAFQSKHSWVVRHEGLIFGSGWYEDLASKSDPAAYTQEFVAQAIRLYEAIGLEDTIAFYNTLESIDGQWYVFIADENDVMIAHAAVPENVGKPPEQIVGPGGYPAGAQVAAAATAEGAWTDYTYVNPATGAFQSKHTWVIRHDGLVFGSGWYEDLASKADPAAFTQEFVAQAIRLYDAIGREETFAYYNTPESVDEDWYIFIIDENENTIIHPTRPELRGTSPKTRVDVRGKAYGEELVAATADGVWVDYYFLNPATGYEEQKHAWAVKHDGLIFASGWYERAEAEDDATYTQSFVHRAIQRYDAQGRDAALEFFSSELSVQGQWYVFVLDENQVTIAHPNPEHIGRTRDQRIDKNGFDYGAEFLTTTEEGKWISYVFLNPDTDQETQKHTWLIQHDGLYFGSGWYEEVKE
jgi:signal transduction histidine kinase